MHLEGWKHGNRDKNGLCSYSGCYGCYGAHVHVQLPIKVWFCFPRRLNNTVCCFKCL